MKDIVTGLELIARVCKVLGPAAGKETGEAPRPARGEHSCRLSDGTQTVPLRFGNLALARTPARPQTQRVSW